ncbi:hypothetical protein SCLCIDRAFT_9140 [Scleroderma citrinum Foug A]|uniref:Uncharacterized protein n=1 Tax=Scleroderma citrinum Foug A TaxID=1036808 RepID=A0A0C2ZL28_9AGAM|nr:hypothetical protein SCLCIDRAFT_9140 [Scleroderma citrinum Foug A]
MQGVPEEELDTSGLVARLLTITSATTHTSASALMHALLELADRTTYVEPLRKEAAKALSTHGLTRVKIVSSKNQHACTQLAACPVVTFPLKAMKPITLSDGTYIPKDSFVMTSVAVHFDEEFYENPYTFDGFRLVTPTADGAAPSAARQLLTFTLPLHSPGRYVVAYGLKALMAHTVFDYDMKLGGDGKVKSDMWFTTYRLPNKNAT